MQIQELLELSKILDYKFREGKQLSDDEVLNKSILGLIVEVGEFCNEAQPHKYWKNNKSIDQEKVDEEYIDILFFYLSIANQLGYTGEKLEELYINKYMKNLKRIETGY